MFVLMLITGLVAGFLLRIKPSAELRGPRTREVVTAVGFVVLAVAVALEVDSRSAGAFFVTAVLGFAAAAVVDRRRGAASPDAP